MLKSRRNFIKKVLSYASYGWLTSTGFLYSGLAKAQWTKEFFAASNYQDILNQLFPDVTYIKSKKIKFSRLPRKAENGAIVPIKITCDLENVHKIIILVRKNPHPLIAEFFLSSAVASEVTARIKMAKSGDVTVIAEAEGKIYYNKQHVKVTVGGCGG
ncbi:MAG: thiosulfate oxidation carrier protein SoxY [Methylococcales bacterium]|nr:thiosulfate oxidation carrier protein SoxY [Methylococcales bacterium]